MEAAPLPNVILIILALSEANGMVGLKARPPSVSSFSFGQNFRQELICVKLLHRHGFGQVMEFVNDVAC